MKLSLSEIASLDLASVIPHCAVPPATVGMTTAEKKATLDLHNLYRSKVVKGEVQGLPKARTMNRLKWNTTLEAEAQRHELHFTSLRTHE
jgi:hypothetical protein